MRRLRRVRFIAEKESGGTSAAAKFMVARSLDLPYPFAFDKERPPAVACRGEARPSTPYETGRSRVILAEALLSTMMSCDGPTFLFGRRAFEVGISVGVSIVTFHLFPLCGKNNRLTAEPT